MTASGGVQYSKIAEIKGPLVVVDDVENAAFDELVEIETKEGERRLGKVLEVGNGKAIVQVFEGTSGLSISGTCKDSGICADSKRNAILNLRKNLALTVIHFY